jgi:Transcriptional repressor TCF25
MRGTWRTAFEWTKLLFSLDPEDDPYAVGLSIDQFALRAKQGRKLLDLTSLNETTEQWKLYCNIAYSKALAHHQLKETVLAREALKDAICRFPWVIPDLFKELGISRVPPTLWGLEPPSDFYTLTTALYVKRGKDTWNTPETTSLLVEVAETFKTTDDFIKLDGQGLITLDIARHIVLTEIPSLIALLPRELSSRNSSASDPLPPGDAGLPPQQLMAPSMAGRMQNLLQELLVRAPPGGDNHNPFVIEEEEEEELIMPEQLETMRQSLSGRQLDSVVNIMMSQGVEEDSWSGQSHQTVRAFVMDLISADTDNRSFSEGVLKHVDERIEGGGTVLREMMEEENYGH